MCNNTTSQSINPGRCSPPPCCSDGSHRHERHWGIDICICIMGIGIICIAGLDQLVIVARLIIALAA